jgi:hypothetical protein
MKKMKKADRGVACIICGGQVVIDEGMGTDARHVAETYGLATCTACASSTTRPQVRSARECYRLTILALMSQLRGAVACNQSINATGHLRDAIRSVIDQYEWLLKCTPEPTVTLQAKSITYDGAGAARRLEVAALRSLVSSLTTTIADMATAMAKGDD